MLSFKFVITVFLLSKADGLKALTYHVDKFNIGHTRQKQKKKKTTDKKLLPVPPGVTGKCSKTSVTT